MELSPLPRIFLSLPTVTHPQTVIYLYSQYVLVLVSLLADPQLLPTGNARRVRC